MKSGILSIGGENRKELTMANHNVHIREMLNGAGNEPEYIEPNSQKAGEKGLVDQR